MELRKELEAVVNTWLCRNCVVEDPEDLIEDLVWTVKDLYGPPF